jgi:hypothetical protein
MSVFASTIMKQKYSHDLTETLKEEWPQIARRVAVNVLGAVKAPRALVDEMTKLI